MQDVSNKSRNNNLLVLSIENIGYLHNAGCFYMLNNWDTTWDISKEQDFQLVWGMICEYFETHHSFDSEEAFNSLYEILHRVSSSENYYYELLVVFDELKQHYVWTSLISDVEKELINGISEIFTNNFSNLSHSEICDFVITKVDSLKSIWRTIDWDERGVFLSTMNMNIQSIGLGSLSFGALDVLHRSAEFWKEHDPMPSSPSALLGALLKVDAIGYIVGWLKAVKDDIDAGKLTPDRANIRIQKGINAATYASLGWALGKR